MASTTSTPLSRPKKQTVYGKSTGKPYSPANSGFFEDDEVAWVPVVRDSKKAYPPAKPRAAKAAAPKPDVPPTSPLKKSGALPQVKRSLPRRKDEFDVPSDDDESTETYTQVPLPPKQRFQSRLVDEPTEEEEQLAPWEEKATRKGKIPSNTTARSSRSKNAANGVQEKPATVQRDDSALSAPAAGESSQAHKDKDVQEVSGMTAMERLAARRKKAQENKEIITSEHGSTAKDLPKRSVETTSAHEALQNKRRRVTPQPTSPSANEPLDEPTATSITDKAASPKAAPADGGNIFDMPSDEETTRPSKPVVKRTIQVRARPRAPGALRRETPQKGLSAPSRLQAMITSDDEFGFPSTEPTPPETPATPQTALRNGRKAAQSTPDSTSSSASRDRKPGTLTPKQTQLWADLLEPDAVPATGMKKLSITQSMMQTKSGRSKPAPLERSSSDNPIKRTRIIDRLKASAPNSSDEESESEDEVMAEDGPDTNDFAAEPLATSTTASQEADSLSQMGHSQDKHTKPTASGSLITYAKQRSHLADDSLDSAIMFDLPMDAPERPAATARRVGTPAGPMSSNKYDVDDLDDAPASGARTIHELRAEGRNARVMGEIEDLIGEVQDRANSARSRRRGALLDLTTKLFDKSFAEQIISHGFENTLLAECKTPSDPPADFLLIISLLLLLRSEPPSHALDAFAEVLPCIARLLAESTDIAKVAKERRSNMSKSTQGDVVVLSDKLKADQTLWGELSPSNISSRVVALKTIELAVRNLRETGNKSELLGAGAVALILPQSALVGLQSNAVKAFEANLIISILEALKTFSTGGNWSDSCAGSIGALPSIFAEEWQAPSHTKWIAYRLCANITNESGPVQLAFVEKYAVRHLMAEVVNGFDLLHNPSVDDDTSGANGKRDFDILLLAIGTLINLTEHSTMAQQQAVEKGSLDSLKSIVQIFLEGQEQAIEAVSEEQSAANVAYGYLSIMLANICQDDEARTVVRSLLPGDKMDVLVAAVEEFVKHHQKVDEKQSGESGQDWSGFTERLLGVLVKLKAGEGDGR